MNTIKISSGSPYEHIVGYSRAVRSGRMIFVSGTAPMDPDGSTVFPGDLYRQSRRCLEIIGEAIESLGGTIDDVVRTRVYLTDASRWEEAGKAHGELFGEIRPASTFLEVNRLLRDDWLVEIEAECVVMER